MPPEPPIGPPPALQEGTALLDRLRAVLGRYVILPSDAAADAVTRPGARG